MSPTSRRAPASPHHHITTSPHHHIPPRAYVAWAVVCVVWGTTYLAIRIALETIPPFLMGGIRYVSAGAILAVMIVARGRPLPGPSAWASLSLLGLLLLGFGNGGRRWAGEARSSGVTAVCGCASTV